MLMGVGFFGGLLSGDGAAGNRGAGSMGGGVGLPTTGDIPGWAACNEIQNIQRTESALC